MAIARDADTVGTDCPECGTSADDLLRTRWLDEHDIIGLLSLWSPAMEGFQCAGCKRRRAGHPPVEVRLASSARLLRIPGTWDAGTVFDPSWRPHDGAELLADLPALRDALREALARTAEPLQAPPTPTSASADWRLVTAAAVAAAAVLRVLDRNEGALLPGPPSVAALAMLQDLGERQGDAWAELAKTAASLVRDGARLMAEVGRLVRPGAVVPGAVTRFDATLSRLLARSPMRFDAYCMLAVAACVHDAASASNPLARQWADAWFFQETDGFNPVVPDAALKERARLDDDLARRTLPASEVVRVAQRTPFLVLERGGRLDRATIDAGFEKFAAALRRIGQEDLAPQAMKSLFETIPPKARKALLAAAPTILSPVVEEPFDGLAAAVETVDEGRDLMRKAQARNHPSARAVAEARVGGAFNRLHAPEEFLKAVGAHARSWERSLPDRVRFDLQLERSRALRLAGRPREALAMARKLERLSAGLEPRQARLLHQDLAMLLTSTGAPDQAVARLEWLVEICPDAERPGLLGAVADAYQFVGRHADAADALARARGFRLSAPPEQVRFTLREALASANAGEVDRALRLLDEMPAFDPGDFEAVLAELAARSAVIDRRIDARDASRLDALERAAAALAAAAAEEGNHHRAEVAWQVVAQYHDIVGATAKAAGAAAAVERSAAARSAPPDAAMSLLMATEAFLQGAPADARAVLEAAPDALAARYGAAADQEAVLAGLGDLKRWFERLARAADRHGSPADVRVVMELRREAFRQAHSPRNSAAADRCLYASLDDAALGRLAPEGGVVVVEWIDLGGAGRRPRLTRLDPGGAVRTIDLTPPPEKPADVGAAILARLQAWTGRGDPFDLDSWIRLQAWAREVLGREIAEGGHVVFIEDHSSGHVPWHVMVGCLASVSYAQSWSMLLRSDGPIRKPPEGVLGVLMIPRRNEHEPILRAFTSARERLADLAPTARLRFASAGPRADRRQALDLIGRSHFAALLCHGVLLQSEGEVALLVAEDGKAPSFWLAAGDGGTGNPHRLSWRDLASAKHAAPIVASVACSSGAGYFAGLGERLGLFREFSRAGSRALVAPRWKSHAPAVGAVLVDFARRHLVDGIGLARALREASLAAEHAGMPPRHAWNLALEGEWR
jgi:hypothetical protein